MSASNKERKVPVLVDKPMDFCPGCGHGIISRLIMECLDELEQSDNIIFPIGVGCSSNLGAGLECDRLHCSHGRAGAVATGMKRVNPDVLIVSYQGDCYRCEQHQLRHDRRSDEPYHHGRPEDLHQRAWT